jgi:dihydroneopterin aldolase
MSKVKTAGRSSVSAFPGAPVSGRAAERGDRRVFIRDLVLTCRIGVHQHERVASQRVRINLDLSVEDPGPVDDDLDKVVCYSQIMTGIRHVVGAGHVNLVETLAERIAAMCLEDRRVRAARVRIEKLDVYPEAESVGVEIERLQTRP